MVLKRWFLEATNQLIVNITGNLKNCSILIRLRKYFATKQGLLIYFTLLTYFGCNCRTPQVRWGTCRHWREGHCINSGLEAGCGVLETSCGDYCRIHCGAPSCRRVPFRQPVTAFRLGQPKVRAATEANPEMERPRQDQQDLWWLDRRNWLGRGAPCRLLYPV